MKFILSLFVLFITAVPVSADTAGGPVSDVIFGEEEKRIISDYMKKKMGLPDTARKSSSEDEDADEDDETNSKGKKAKKDKKNKGKGKDKGKNKKKKMPPGLAERDELPPGLAKRHTLPPGLAVRELPEELENQLPPTPEGSERIIADENVVLIEKATGRILDIIMGGPNKSDDAQ